MAPSVQSTGGRDELAQSTSQSTTTTPTGTARPSGTFFFGVVSARMARKERTMTIRSSIGVSRNPDPEAALDEALASARSALGRDVPRAGLVLTTRRIDLETARHRVGAILGQAPWMGGAVAGILTDEGMVASGAAVMCFSGEALASSVASSGPAEDLGMATERVGRLVLAGAVYRRHYPRGMALAFTGSSAAGVPGEFPARWRELAGPRLRTILNVLAGPAYYGPGGQRPGLLTALCLEGAHQTGVGVTQGLDGVAPTSRTLVQCAVEAALSASKRLEGQPARAVLVAESVERYHRLGAASRDEWTAIREKVGQDAPCLGWLAGSAYAFGRGVIAGGSAESVIIVAMGEVPASRAPSSEREGPGD